jgi:hypothetical protein
MTSLQVLHEIPRPVVGILQVIYMEGNIVNPLLCSSFGHTTSDDVGNDVSGLNGRK